MESCSWFFVEREGSPRDVDGAALQDARRVPTPVPDDLHQESDLNIGEVTRLLSDTTLWMVTWS